MPVVGRIVRAGVERFTVRGEEDRHRPPAMPGHRLRRLHVDGVDVRALLAVDLDADEVLVHQRGDRVVLERLALHDVAPVACRVADTQQDRATVRARQRQGGIAPRPPVYRILRMLKQIGAGFGSEMVGHRGEWGAGRRAGVRARGPTQRCERRISPLSCGAAPPSAANFIPSRLAPVSRTSKATPSRIPGVLLRLRHWWWAAAIPLLVIGSAVVATSPVRDAATLGPVPEVAVRHPMAYLLFAPFSDLLDVLTLLSLRQHVAFVVTLAAGYAVYWWLRGRHAPDGLTRTRRLVRQTARLGLALLTLVGIYILGALLPRPMAALEASANILVVDFHAHTSFSHDGRPGWGPDDVRRWHADAGYGAVYVTDHRTFEGARDGWANNPAIAGEATTLLPGIEVVWKGEHVNVLDADRVYRGLLTPTLRDIDDEALTLASAVGGKEPLLIETLPGDLNQMIPARGSGTPGVRAIELIDGAPKGLGQTRQERARILRLADSLDLALVSGSNHHGWGHTASGWTLLFVPQWRAMSPDQLSGAIGLIIRRGGAKGTRVVERWIPDTDQAVLVPFTVPIVAWGMLRTLSYDERVVWLAWTLLAALLVQLRHVRDARRARRSTP